MGKSSSGRQRAGSETSLPSDKRRDSTRESTTSSRRKSSRRDDPIDERDDTTVASSRTTPSTYVTAFTAEPLPNDPPQEARASRVDPGSKYGSSRGDGENDGQKRRSGRESGRDRRDSRKCGRSDRRDSTRAFGDHDASLPENQFPGEIPSTFTQPFRPPGLAADYYGDQGESVSFQPGVRPNQPSIVTSAEQAHLMEPSVEARPPTEPSSLGQVGAAASYFGGSVVQNDSGVQHTPSKPSQRLDHGPDRPPQHSSFGASPRSSPTPSGYPSMPPQQGSGGGSQFAASAAAEYYSGSAFQTPPRLPSAPFDGSGPHSAPAGAGPSFPNPNPAVYGAAGVAAGAAGAAYLSHHSTEHSHGHYQGPSGTTHPARYSSGSTQMQHKREHKHRSPLGKFVDWFRDPKAVAEYEQYTEAIGVCKYCFDPMSSPADAPRRHHYRPRRTSSGSRYGSTTRVDKTYRYSSDEERKRRSAAKKVVVGGLAGYGAAKVGEAVFKANHDFDDTYSVKSGRPAAASRVSFQDEETRSTTRSKYYSSTEDLRGSSRRATESKPSKTTRRQDKRGSRRRDSSSSSSSHGISRGAALSAGVGAAGIAMGAAALNKKLQRDSGRRSRSRSRSHSPPSRKTYYSKRVSPMHSYVDLSTTSSGPTGITGFFTSPSANMRKGKKAKGLFSFSNASTSSSDADLAYGAGTVRRKRSTRRLSGAHDHSRQYESTAGMMGLVKLGNDLASESDRRRSKGKRVSDTHNKAGQDARYSNNHGISMQDQVQTGTTGQDEDWYDTDDSDAGLAYGSGASAFQNQESHAPTPRYPQDHYPRDHFVGESNGWPTNSSKRHSATYNQPPRGDARKLSLRYETPGAEFPADYSAKPPPMQELEPRPLSNSGTFDDRQSRHDSYYRQNGQPFQVASTSVPLHQPQPVVPVIPFINQSAYTAPPNQDRRSADYRRTKPSFEDLGSYRNVAAQSSGNRTSRGSRRDSSPAKLLSQDPRNNVSFALTDEQLESERKGSRKGDRRGSKKEDKDRRKSADAALVMGAGALVAGVLAHDNGSSRRRASEAVRDTSSQPDEREAEIDRQLQALHDEKRRQDERKRALEQLEQPRQSNPTGKEITGPEIARRSSSSEDSSGRRRKSSLKKSKVREASPNTGTQQERIARMAAQRVKSTPSPVHEDYGNFFVPQELVEHLKEHNEKAEHRDDIGANIVEIVPGASKSKRRNPFDPFLYRPFGLDVDDDPALHPWPVPMLELVEPTPPGSQTHSDRGDVTPIARPSSVEPADDVGEPLERKASNGSKVTWGDHDTYVYEVQTPEYERSDYIPDHEASARGDNTTEGPKGSNNREHAEPRPNVGRTWTLDDVEAEVLEREGPSVSDRPHISRAWTVDDQEAKQIEHPSEVDRSRVVEDMAPHLIEIEPKQAETSFLRQLKSESQDTARSNAHPEDSIKPKQEFYHSPFAETISDLGVADHQSPRSGSPNGKMQQERSGLQDKPEDMEADLPDVRLSKSEKRRLERASSSSEYPTEQPLPPTEPLDRAAGPAGTESVFDFLVDDGGKSTPSAAVVGLGAAAILAAHHSNKDSKQHDNPQGIVPDDDDVGNRSEFRRSNTFNDSTSQHLPQSRSKTDPQSDPEDWERSRTSKKGKKSNRTAQSEIGIGDKRTSQPRDETSREETGFGKPRRSHTESELTDNFDKKSSASGRKRKSKRSEEPSEQTREDSTSMVGVKDDDRPRRKSKRDSQIFDDDDTQSVTSSPADLDKRSREKDKKSPGGFFSNIFSTNRSDVSTSSKRSSKSTKSESRADRGRDEGSESRKKHRSKDQDFDDVASAASEPLRSSRRSSERAHKDASKKPFSRDESLDDGFVSAEESTQVPSPHDEDDKSFLGKRPEMPQPTDIAMPMDTDGVSGLASGKESSNTPTTTDELPSDLRRSLSQQDNVDLLTNRDPNIERDTDTVSKPSAALRRLSAIQTHESDASPTTPSYPTAIPVHFRLPASSPIAPRFSMSSPIASPASPLTTPRTRQGRPKSTEFAGKNIRPLYLVEASNSSKIASPDTDDYPPLPASIASSSHPSMEDLRAEAQMQEQSEIFTPSRLSADKFRDQARRQSYSYWHDGEERRRSPDYLDSRSATPVPGEAQRARDRENKPKPKYEFHSPSELLQDPSLLYGDDDVEDTRPGSPLPSVVSTDLDYMSARSRSLSPPRARSLSRGRRSASGSRSTSASWQDAMSTAAVGALVGSALGLVAHGALKQSSPTDPEPQEAVTPTKAEFGSRELVSSVGPAFEEGSGNRLPEEEGSTADDDIDRKPRDQDLIDDVVLHDPSDQKPDTRSPAISRLAADSVAMSQFSDGSIGERALKNLQDERSNRTTDMEASYDDADTGSLSTAAVKAPKKTKKDKKKQKQKQLASTLNDDLLPSTAERAQPQDFEVPEASTSRDATAQDPHTQSIGPELEDADRDLMTAIDQPAASDSHSSAPPLDYFEDRKKLHDDATVPSLSQFEDPSLKELTASVDQSLEPEAHPEPSPAALETASLPQSDVEATHKPHTELTPFEQALEDAVQARGLSDGTTMAVAYEAFLPDAPNELSENGGTPLTTIEEENEPLTPGMQQSNAILERKNSKKSKRKEKKAVGGESVPESSIESRKDAHTQPLSREADPQPQQVPLGQSGFYEPEAFVNERDSEPNPFGNDFELTDKDADASTRTEVIMPDSIFSTDKTTLDQALASDPAGKSKPNEEVDDWATSITKKGKKDKKDRKGKKRQSLSWEDSAENIVPAETRIPSASAMDINPDSGGYNHTTPAETRSTDPLQADIVQQDTQGDQTNAENVSVQDKGADQAQASLNEAEDPWEMGAKKSKKSKKNKRKSLTWADEENLSSYAEAPAEAPAPHATDSALEGNRPSSILGRDKEAIIEEQFVQEPVLAIAGDAVPVQPEQAVVLVPQEPMVNVEAAPAPFMKDESESTPEEPVYVDDVSSSKSTKKSKKQKKRDSEALAAAAAVAVAGAVTLSQAHVDGSDCTKVAAPADGMITTGEVGPSAVDSVQDIPHTDEERKPAPNVSDLHNEPAQLPSTTPADITSPADGEKPVTAPDLDSAVQPFDRASSEQDNEAVQMQPPVESPAVPEQEPEDLFPVVSKKSKKDKKKKRQNTFDEPVANSIEDVVSSTAVDTVPIGKASNAESSDPKSILLPAQELESLQTETQEGAEDFGFDDRKKTKKDKKDKKKKRQSKFDDFEATTGNDPTAVETAPKIPAEEYPEPPAVSGTDAIDPDQRPSAEAFDDGFATMGRRSKKEKQQKRASATQADSPKQQPTLATIDDLHASEASVIDSTTTDASKETQAFKVGEAEDLNQVDSTLDSGSAEITNAWTSTSDTNAMESKDDSRTVERSIVETPMVEPSPKVPVVETPMSVPTLDDVQVVMSISKGLEEESHKFEAPVDDHLGTDAPRTGTLDATNASNTTSDSVSETKPAEIASESLDENKLTTGDSGVEAASEGSSDTQQPSVDISVTEIPTTDDTLSDQKGLEDGAGDDWEMTSKKSKKDKKKKRQNIPADVVREPATLEDDFQDSVKDLSPDLALPSAANQSDTLDTAEINETPATVTSQDKSVVEDDWGSSTKKSKKDKKKKRQSLLASPPNERDAPMDDTTNKSEDLPAERAEPAVAMMPDMIQASPDPAVDGGSSGQLDVVADDDWGFSTKKSKKEKKKKRQSTFDYAAPDNDTSELDAPASAMPAPLQDVDEPAHTGNSLDSAPGLLSDARFAEPDAVGEGEPVEEAQDGLWPVKTKKSKKDKKKARTTADLPAPEIDQSSIATEVPTVDSLGRLEESIPDYGTVTGAEKDPVAQIDKTVESSIDRVPTTTTEHVDPYPADASDAKLDPLLGEAPVEDDVHPRGSEELDDGRAGREIDQGERDVFATKKSKKDKKKKKPLYDWDDISNPANPDKTSGEGVTSSTNIKRELVNSDLDMSQTGRASASPAVGGVLQLDASSEDSGSKTADMTLAQDDITSPEPEISKGDDNSLQDQILSHELVRDPEESLGITQHDLDLGESGPSQQEADDILSSSKKEKKEKKKNRKSMKKSDTPTPSAIDDHQSQQVERTLEQQQATDPIDPPAKEDTGLVERPEAVADDQWNFDKKSKKGSKKSRKSTLGSSFDHSVPLTAAVEAVGQLEEDPEAAGDAEVPDIESLDDVGSKERQADPVDPDADEFGSWDRKSKKQKGRDKKAAVKSSFDLSALSEDDKDTESEDKATRNQSPSKGLDILERDKPAAVPFVEDEWAPSKKTKKDKKKKRQSTVDELIPNEGAQATNLSDETSLNDMPGLCADGGTMLTPLTSVADQEAKEPATETVGEDEWAPTKKSKKDKKKRQSTLDKTLEEIGSTTPTTELKVSDEIATVQPTKAVFADALPEEAIIGAESTEALAAEPGMPSSTPIAQFQTERDEKEFVNVGLDAEEPPTEPPENQMNSSSLAMMKVVPDDQPSLQSFVTSGEPEEPNYKSIDIVDFVPGGQEAVRDSVEDVVKPVETSIPSTNLEVTGPVEPSSGVVDEGPAHGMEVIESLDKSIDQGSSKLEDLDMTEQAAAELEFNGADSKETGTEPEFMTLSKRSKKDKKKKRMSTLDDTIEEPKQELVNAPENLAIDAQPPEPAAAAEPEDEFVFSSKKSKKEKKKKRQSTIENTVTDSQEISPSNLEESGKALQPEQLRAPEKNATSETEEQLSSSYSAWIPDPSDLKTSESPGPVDTAIRDNFPETEVPNVGQPEGDVGASFVKEGIKTEEVESVEPVDASQVAELSNSRNSNNEGMALESRNLDDVAVTEPDWALSSKKTKKDKKKRQSMFNETVVKPHEDDASTFNADGPTKEATETPMNTQPEPTVSTQELHHGPATVIQDAESNLPIVEFSQHNDSSTSEFGIPQKKSKKDKKKNRQSKSVQNDLENPQSERLGMIETDNAGEESTEVLHPEMDKFSLVTGGDAATESYAQSGLHDGPDGFERSEHTEQQERSDEMQVDEKQATLTDQTADRESVQETTKIVSKDDDTFAAALAAASAPAVLEPEWATTSKKSKKEKKKKRQSTVEESAFETSPPEPPLTEETRSKDESVSVDAPVPTEDWGFSGKKSKKNKKRTKLEDFGEDLQTSETGTPRSTDQFDTAVQTPSDQPSITRPIDFQEGLPDASEPPAPPSEDYFPTVDRKKSKKEKKRQKTSLLWSEADKEHVIESQKNTTSIPEAEGAHVQPKIESKVPEDWPAVAQHQESAPIELPNRMDIDERNEPIFLDEADRTQHQEHHLSRSPDPSHRSQLEESETSTLMKSQTKPSRDGVGGAVSLEESIFAQQQEAAPVNQHEHDGPSERTPVMDETASPRRTKSKKSKKENRIFEFNGTEMVDSQPLKPEDEAVPRHSAGSPIDNLGHGTDPSAVQSKGQDEHVYEDPENLSDVSASTRERRKRRRSPPTWAGEEPEDLPRNRSLTPPPEHDALMDTALVVAAGLGFGAAEHELTRSARPRSSSPTRKQSTGWSFAKLGPGAVDLGHVDSNRDSGVQFESPTLPVNQFSSTRDSGFISESSERPRDGTDRGLLMSLRPPRPQSPTSSTEDVSKQRQSKSSKDETPALETPRRRPSPVDSTSKERSSVLFNSSPAVPTPLKTKIDTVSPEPVSSPLRRSPSIHGHHHSREELKQKARVSHDLEPKDMLASNLIDRSAKAEVHREAFSPGPDVADRAFLPNRMSLNTIREDPVDSSMTTGDQHPFASPPVTLSPQPRASRDNLKDVGLAAAVGAAGLTALALSKSSSRDSDPPHAKSLGRSKSRTSSLRNLRANTASPYDAINAAAGPSHIPVNDTGIADTGSCNRDMSDIYVSTQQKHSRRVLS